MAAPSFVKRGLVGTSGVLDLPRRIEDQCDTEACRHGLAAHTSNYGLCNVVMLYDQSSDMTIKVFYAS